MKILMVHNRYLQRGGEDESTNLEIALLRENRHEVDNAAIVQQSPIRTGIEAIWSSHAYQALRERIHSGGHDLVHVQNFFPQLSPSIHFAAKAEHKPVVQTLRNYRLMCLNGLLLRDGHVCEDCLPKFVPWPGVLHRCYRQSTAASSAVAAMLTVHRTLRTWQRKVDIYVALTNFARTKYVQAGLPDQQIMVKPNFVMPDPLPGEHQAGFALFVGRLSAEKGVELLLQTLSRLPDIPVKIVGDGPLSERVHEFSAKSNSIQCLGRLDREATLGLMRDARLLVFPSESYEGFPRVIVEAFACGLPVIASALGAAAEIVADHSTGLLFSAGDPVDLANKLKWAWDQPVVIEELGHKARKEYELKYAAERNYQILMDIYQRATSHSEGALHDHSAS
jgi:glycosyltransferase involved in cell wall biosynthesis